MTAENLALDFADKRQEALFPEHGWALNGNGVKLLWLPICRLLSGAASLRKSQGLSSLASRDEWEARCFLSTLEKVCLSLLKVSECMAVLNSFAPLEEANDLAQRSAFVTRREAPFYFECTYIYVRKLADDFARSVRHILFEHPGSAPRDLKSLIRLAERDGFLRYPLSSICDGDKIREALLLSVDWFIRLRGENELKKGIRDVIIHHPSISEVTYLKVDNGPWTLNILLNELGPNPKYKADLLSSIEPMIKGICRLWAHICEAIEWSNAYEDWGVPQGDIYFLARPKITDDIVAFWPQIGKAE